MNIFMKLLTGAIFMSIVLAGCVSSAAPQPMDVSSSDNLEAPKTDELVKEITYVLSPGPMDLDPLHAYSAVESQIYTGVYEGLVTYNPLSIDPVPGIARYWEISEDNLVYTFYLRDGLSFWNGDPVTANDVRLSWLRMINPVHKAEYSVFFDIIEGVKDYKANPDAGWDKVGIKAVDDKTLEVTLEKPASHFLKILCHMAFVPVYSKYRDKEGWGKDSSLVTNGPFYILERTKKKMVLAKNKLYWDAVNVKFDKLVILFSDDAKQIAGLFNSGTVQWASAADLNTIKDKTSFIVNPMFSTTYFYFNCNKPPFDNPLVRRGLALLLPWDEMRSKEYLFIAETLVPHISGYPSNEGIAKQDEEEGMKLLAEAGFGAVPSIPSITISISDDPDSKKLASIMKKTWEEKLGSKVDVTVSAPDKYLSALKNDSYTLGMMSWIGDFADPLTFLQMWTSGSNLNDAKYKNCDYDALIEESLKESGTLKYEALGKAEKIILDGAAVLPIRRHPAFNIVNLKTITGWYPNVLDIHPFKYLRFKEDEILRNVTMAEKPDFLPRID
jgi:oligopeptide transport system substrate-binding protein